MSCFLQVRQSGEVTLNPHSWHASSNMLFLDQPVGTGLAYTRNKKYPTRDSEVDESFYQMLLAFLALHPSYVTEDPASGLRQSRPLVLAGESHAGHYIPCMARFILRRNEQARAGGGGLIIRLDGLLIGNGWIDPFHQYDVSDYAHGQGLISDGQRHTMKVRHEDRLLTMLPLVALLLSHARVCGDSLSWAMRVVMRVADPREGVPGRPEQGQVPLGRLLLAAGRGVGRLRQPLGREDDHVRLAPVQQGGWLLPPRPPRRRGELLGGQSGVEK